VVAPDGQHVAHVLVLEPGKQVLGLAVDLAHQHAAHLRKRAAAHARIAGAGFLLMAWASLVASQARASMDKVMRAGQGRQ
jgi:hypothetical protein